MTSKFKIVITDFISDSLELEKKMLHGLASIEALNAQNENDLSGRIDDADALIVYHCVSLRSSTLARLKKCKLIVRAGVGIDNVDYAFARTRGIPVSNIPDYGSEEVADSAIGMMLSMMRGINVMNSRLRSGDGKWSYEQVKPLSRLRNLSLGIIGLGRIGTASALRAKALGMNVVFYDPFKPDGFDKALGIRREEDLKTLLGSVEALTLHCPLTRETHHMINQETVDLLRPGSYLVNTARGGIVNTVSVLKAIESGRLAGAALDVLEEEPPVRDVLVKAWRDPAHPAHHRVIINPHAAFYCEEGLEEIRVKAIRACMKALNGEEVRNVVN